MKNTKTLFRFFTLFEYEEEEAFLENQHKNGWKVTSYKLPGFYKFEKCDPEEVTYRIDFTNARAPRAPGGSGRCAPGSAAVRPRT